jgi:DNA-binding NarL/FixJ family response regulator
MNSPGHSPRAHRESPMGRKRVVRQVEARHQADEAGGNNWPIRTVVADDSPLVLKTLSSFLEQQRDIQLVGTATDGPHAVRRVVELEPDLVLMDSRLSGLNGLEAARQIKARERAPAVIIVTEDDTPGCRAAASAAGMDGFVGKGLIFKQLQMEIRRLFPGTPP